MSSRSGSLITLSALCLLATSVAGFAEDAATPSMHMHKSEMDHRANKEVALEYKTEASQLSEKAESHKKLAELYRGRTPVKGAGDYSSIAKHCDNLAKLYAEAAKEADSVSSELNDR